MTKIKIHDAEWFKENCCISKNISKEFRPLRPKGAYWKKIDKSSDLIYWLSGGEMHALAGKVLEVTEIRTETSAGNIYDAKYYAGGYAIPNWAIEWVKEE
jgi:hypothetical protein